MDESRLELKVGALLIAAVVGLLGLLYLMGELSIGGGTRLQVDFGHTGNVVRGAPVKLGGVVVGRVENIGLLPARRDADGEPMPVSMTLSISKEAAAALRNDVSVTISSQGPLGEPYFELNPGLGDQAWPLDKAIRGTDSPRIDVVSNKLAGFLEAASKMLEKDPDAVAHFIANVSSLTKNVDGMVGENRANVKLIAEELAAAAKDLRAVSAQAKAQLEPGGKASTVIDDASAITKTLRADVPVLSKEAQIALGGMSALTGGFTAEDNRKLKAAIDKYTAAGERLDGIAVRADRLLTSLEKGEGTAGKLIKDPQVYDDLKSLLADLKKHPWKMLWKD